MAALDAIDDWPVPAAAAAVIGTSGVLASHGDTARTFALASLTKPLVARAAQIAVEEGVVDRDTAAGPPDSTVRHLLAHASGLAMDSDRVLAKAKPLGDTGAVALDQYVGFGDELEHEFAPLVGLEIGGHDAPVAHHGVFNNTSADTAPARGRAIDAHHVGTQIPQDHRGMWARPDAGQFDNT